MLLWRLRSRHSPADTLIPGFKPPEDKLNNCPLFKPPGLWYFAKAALGSQHNARPWTPLFPLYREPPALSAPSISLGDIRASPLPPPPHHPAYLAHPSSFQSDLSSQSYPTTSRLLTAAAA